MNAARKEENENFVHQTKQKIVYCKPREKKNY
jgi:hypothetical protein